MKGHFCFGTFASYFLFMKTVISIFAIVLVMITTSCSEKVKEQGDRGYHVKIGDNVENINFDLIDGYDVSLVELKGKVVVLQFTASWCSVCRKEMPYLEKEVWQKHKNDNFILIGVDYDEPLEKVIAFAEKMNVTYPIAMDPDGSIFNKFAYKGAGVTRNVVIGKDGRIAYLTRLFEREEFDHMKDIIANLVNE